MVAPLTSRPIGPWAVRAHLLDPGPFGPNCWTLGRSGPLIGPLAVRAHWLGMSLVQGQWTCPRPKGPVFVWVPFGNPFFVWVPSGPRLGTYFLLGSLFGAHSLCGYHFGSIWTHFGLFSAHGPGLWPILADVGLFCGWHEQ